VWRFDFVFDDGPAIQDNAALAAGDWWRAAFGTVHTPLANRPLACLSLVVDAWLFGPGPFGPHVGNLLLHLANSALLFALVRATLLAPNLAARFDRGRATRFATVLAMLWAVHPLGTDAVAYATQRSTLLFSGALLLALLATVRASTSARPLGWRGLAVAAMAAGMASKEDMIVGPLLVVLFDRAFLAPSWRAVSARWGFHLGMAATWLVLVFCIANGPANPTVGYATGSRVTAWYWLLTQAGVVVHYVRLVLWPYPLRGAYDWDIVRELGAAFVPGLGVLALLGLALWCWRARPWWGWLGALFFLLLAPTSTVLPIVTEILAERRMYLPMLAVLVPVVFGVDRLLGRAGAGWLGGLLALAATVWLTAATRSHAATYAGEATFWQAAYDTNDVTNDSFLSAQILSNHGAMLFQQGRLDEAHALFERSMRCENPTPVERRQYAVSLQQRGRSAEAIALLDQVVKENPEYAEGFGSLGTCLAMEQAKDPKGDPAADPRLQRAEVLLRRAVELAPDDVAFLNTLGCVLKARGRWAEAEPCFHRATDLSTERIEPFFNRAEALERVGRGAEIGPMFDALLAARPMDVELRLRLVQFDLRANNPAKAMLRLREVLRIEPGHAQAAAALKELQARVGR
ncbi:MAG TPA: tetratricopeptide repeat protein, partial [Planctomycetota bacterium]|nr:tetratricopeptide repeat protein [Planctomycetota bacterium]